MYYSRHKETEILRDYLTEIFKHAFEKDISEYTIELPLYPFTPELHEDDFRLIEKETDLKVGKHTNNFRNNQQYIKYVAVKPKTSIKDQLDRIEKKLNKITEILGVK